MNRIAIVHFVNYKKGTQSRAAMRGVMLYVTQAKKTEWEGKRLISGINCQPQSVYDDFLNTKLLHHKDSGVMFYHMVQSFPNGAAVDPRQAHEAARRLAEYFEGYEVLVCTHVDREHIHSHCVINSVNFETGKKLHMAKEQIQALMRRNDRICQELGLPVFEAPTQKSRGMSGAEYHAALKGESWKLRLMNVVDECMKYAADKDAFISLMESEGYQVRWESGRKYITYTTPEGMKCRGSKLHEEKYCKEVMEHEFGIRAKIIHGRAEGPQPHRCGDAEESTVQYQTARRTGTADTVHRDPMSAAAGTDKADTAGGRNKLGAGGNSEYAAGVENAHRPDTSAKISDRDTEIAGTDKYDAGTGWEEERKAYLQMAELAAGLRLPHAGQMAGSADDGHRSGAGDDVRCGNGVEQYPKPVSLRPLQVGVSGLVAAEALLDDEDDEERYRRIQAEQEAKNLGAVIGLAAGAAVVVNDEIKKTRQAEPQEVMHQEEPQQTMGGL